MKIHILLFYKFIKIDSPEKLQIKHLAFCKKLKIKGKVLLAHEGVNGSISGTKAQVQKYKAEMRKDKRFKDIEFKEEIGTFHPFNKMIVRVKPEIIRMDQKLNMEKVGKYVTPKEFLDMYNSKEDIVILDARNDYESDVGKFRGAIAPKISTFRQFPDYIKKKFAKKYKKDQKIVMYCTGGIRCEKASAFMIKEGYKDVSQLHGGIIKFCQEKPNTVWQGRCFVFDNRLTSNINQKENPLNKCLHCGSPSDTIVNCLNQKCNRLMYICPSCNKSNSAVCSKKCLSLVSKTLLRS